ncbi:MAG: Ppx/GppA family phosphatase [Actinobacteria bacterium]|nr:Ppx/GppA family phosphatase [Actinomycetota bacterium]NDA38629.1 Ppx/GppA family phosphatase [Actinomycetota bacterium]NDE83279.1 Ppx/GppA family phosphatase [Actinomycetota bacterium]
MSRVAAIDCGTNSIRLLIAEISEGNFREIYRTMEIVRLGEGVDKNKRFDPKAIQRTLSAVKVFSEEITRRAVGAIRFCATSATRDAENRALFIDGVTELLGVTPEVISGEEEAQLSFLGAVRELHPSDAPFLVVDIGGGSTEFVFGGNEVEAAKSVNIGCVRMSERHFDSAPVSAAAIERAIFDIDQAIRAAAEIVPITKARTLVAVAGTATTVAAAALDLESYDRYAIHQSHISATKVSTISTRFLNMSRTELAALGYMHPGRVDVIAAGALVLDRIMKATGLPEFVASESDILDGIAWSIAK